MNRSQRRAFLTAVAALLPRRLTQASNGINCIRPWKATPPPDEQAAHSAPAISVIIPAYNAAAFIGATLNSLMAQTCTDYETIIINDGSSDTAELEHTLEPYRARIIYITQTNAGAAAARNRGLRAARGRYVAFLDADDLWLPDYLCEQLNFIVQGDYDLVYADALIVGDPPQAGRTFMETCPSHGSVTFLSLINQECNIITSGVMARTQTLFSAGLFNDTILSGEDFELWLRVARQGARMAYQRKVLLHYRVRKGSLSGDAVDRVLRELRVYHETLRTYDLTPPESAAAIKMIAGLDVALERETGKQHLVRGELAEAQEAFTKAQQLQPNLKLWVAKWLLRVAPGLALFIARRKAGEHQQ